ncbi:hypothetical protein GCM10010361_70690 [Streptomyces olivaceiscleroticus]|uniref:Aldehyde dehydrogenase domain-containing protein n=1 Tax=Streptomyces olivaceiscleroticus TaxID=68245 RepID=A0ABN1BD04_9ACTN
MPGAGGGAGSHRVHAQLLRELEEVGQVAGRAERGVTHGGHGGAFRWGTTECRVMGSRIRAADYHRKRVFGPFGGFFVVVRPLRDRVAER